ncbi:MAG: DMT family transporter [Lachnospiraceae bacterium]|nr:DMT family transporter [Lachnospiraceae bacterium]
MIGFLIAAISGALMSIQGVFNTEVTKQTGLWLSSAFVQLSAFAVCLIVWLIKERTPVAGLLTVQPKYLLLGGVIGAFITITVVKSMEMMGPAKAVMCIVVTQVIVAYLLEVFGLFGLEKKPLEMQKVVGALIALAGIIVFKWKT